MGKITILIAEDDRTIRRMLEMRLNREGYEVVSADDGKEAIEKLKELEPSLVVTDLMMPFQSGLELIEAVKKKDKSIPVIVLSSAGQENTVKDAFRMEADDFINKPFSPDELLMRIKRLLK